jgi:hypothetical protein
MLSYDTHTLRQLTGDRRSSRLDEADGERMARLARRDRDLRTAQAAGRSLALGHMLAARRHATP